MRSIEQKLDRMDGELGRDLTWLTDELRRTRETLFKVLAMAQEEESSPEHRRAIWLEANETLGLYERD